MRATSAWAWGFVVILIGCSESSSTPLGAAILDAGPPPITLEEYFDQYIEVTCEIASMCNSAQGLEVFLGGPCEDVIGSVYRQAYQPVAEQAVAAGRVVFDGAQAAACIEEVRAAGCRVLDRPQLPACEQTLAGMLGPGAACSYDLECQGDRYCDTGSAGSACVVGSCQALIPAQAACTRDEECIAGHKCSTSMNGSRVCRAPGGAGAPCLENQCAGGLFCVGATMTQTGQCRPVSEAFSAGGSCDPGTGTLCREGLHCVATRALPTPAFECQPEVAAGAACHPGLPDQCPAGQGCGDANVFLGDVDGTCVPLPTAGQGCLASLPACAPDHRCILGTCERVGDIGDACVIGSDCYSGNCESSTCREPELCSP